MIAEPKRAILRFLLGEMSPQERADFEDAYIKDTELFRQVVELENDLIDLYAAGALPRTERKRLERSFLVDSARRKRLVFARVLVQHPAFGQPEVSYQLRRSTTWLPRLQSIRYALLPIFAVAVMAMLMGVLWLLRTNHSLRLELEDLERQQAAARQRTEALQRQIGVLNSKLAARRQQEEKIAQITSRDRTLTTLTLESDAVRSSGELPRLTLGSSSRAVTFHLIFPQDPFHSYDLSVESASGSLIWHEAQARSGPAIAGNKEIVFTVPSRILKAGDYVVRLEGNSGEGREDVAGYSFTVVKPER